jgi:hypothetical protein
MEQLKTKEGVQSVELRQYDDTTTWLAEVLNGSMRTPFEFTFDGNELYGHDGLPLTPVFENATHDAERLAKKNPRLSFELRRRQTEEEELQDMLAMARGEAPNTMVVISDFPAELMRETKDVGGYNVQRKQTMMRVISRRPDGKITMVSQSLEKSDRTALEAIYESLGFKAEEGELLPQRMHVDMAAEEQEFLVDALTGVYDRSLQGNYGGSWRAGWHMPDDRAHLNTYDFVREQRDLLEAYFTLDNDNLDNMLGLAAAMKQRYEKQLNKKSIKSDETLVIDASWVPQVVLPPLLEMRQAARRAIAKGETFSGCGISIGGSSDTEEQLQEQGYGNKADEDGDCEFVSKKCPECGTKNVKTTVRTLTRDGIKKKHISGDCGCSIEVKK